MNMKISALNGVLSFKSGAIGANTTRAQFLSSSLGHAAKPGIAHGARHQFDFHPEPGISATAFFDDERLDRVFLMIRMPGDAEKLWSEARELDRKSTHDRWLAQELGNGPYEYAWGSITSDFDPRGCSSEIIVVYVR